MYQVLGQCAVPEIPHYRAVDQAAVAVVELRESPLVAGPDHPRQQRLVRIASHPEPSPTVPGARPYRLRSSDKHIRSRTLSHEGQVTFRSPRPVRRRHDLLYAPDGNVDDLRRDSREGRSGNLKTRRNLASPNPRYN